MDKIIEYVEVILKHNFAYVANDSVYFDTKAFKYEFLFSLHDWGFVRLGRKVVINVAAFYDASP